MAFIVSTRHAPPVTHEWPVERLRAMEVEDEVPDGGVWVGGGVYALLDEREW